MGTNRITSNTTLPIKLTINNTELDLVTTNEYLGLTLNPQITLIDNINKTIGLVSSKLNTLMINMKKYVYSHTLLMLYKIAILPLMEYGNIVKSLMPLTQYKKLQRLQNQALRIIYANAPVASTEDLHVLANLAPTA